ncbi:U1 small nuclear ribonucleoprotein C [Coemansia sp. RSA 1822]|nr:U1 small nuclear ribonucleoprotein C [Coemansia sp. RSA 638]KAJ2541682.1 U1 small nuclear ribonucleoprotein C [Coemansia sp. RSA 1853]KAJ2564805.1 U1 small nuclear ribonucleoprotein C [Coemansia sp. RSA 1822]
MPKYYCDYCDIFLTHDSSSVRKAHNTGWKHINQVAAYYQALEPSKTQEIIDAITAAHNGQLPVIQAPSGQSYGDRRGDSYGDRRGDSYGDRRGDSYGDRRGDAYGDRRGDSYGAPRRNERRDYGGRAPREGRGFGDRSRGPPVHGRPFRQHEQGPPLHPPPHMRFLPGPPPGFGEALSAPPQLHDRHRSHGT